MIIALNGMYLTKRASGIANCIIDAILELAKTNQIIIFSNNEIEKDIYERLPSRNLKFIIKYRKHSTIWFFIDFPRLLRNEKFDLLWNPAVWTPFWKKGKFKSLVMVHDFVSRDYKQTMRYVNRVVSSIIEKKSIETADYIWCNSEYTKEKLIEYYPKKKSENVFVGIGPNTNFVKSFIEENEKKLFLNEMGITKNFLLFVGNLEPRKNLSFLLSAFKEYHIKNDIQLVIVGANSWGKSTISDIINSPDFPKQDVIFTRYINNKELNMLYNLAACFVSSSINEGFGMPQAEAMKCGCPVVTAHNSAMIEVVDGAGVTVKGWNVDDWCKGIDYALMNREKIIMRQFERVKKYNWEKIIPELVKYLETGKI